MRACKEGHRRSIGSATPADVGSPLARPRVFLQVTLVPTEFCIVAMKGRSK